MKDLLDKALNQAISTGATYADIRIVETVSESIAVKNGKLEKISHRFDTGFGIRVIAGGSWGFASSNILTPTEIEKIAAAAVTIAKASATVQNKQVKLTPLKATTSVYRTPIEIDPFNVSDEEKLELLFDADEKLRQDDRIVVASSSLYFLKKKTYFASTEGSNTSQEIIESGGGISATATDGKEMERRSYPNSMGGQAQCRGYESILEMDLSGNANRVRDEAVALLSAEICPTKETSLILDSSQLALQVHESIGHPVELDRILGMEASFAGTSFISTDDVGSLKYGSPIVNVTADATIPGALGTFGFDDEGVPAQRTDIITDGILTGLLTSRETAGVLKRESNATMRADGWNRTPIIRMTNINLLPGAWSFDDLIADTDDGIYMETNKSWSIDDKRLNFQFATEIAWEISGGERKKMYRSPNYTGLTPEFWNSCDAICNESHWSVWGTPNCGKGEPMQVAHVAHGTSPSRFLNVKVGIGR